MRPLCGFSPSDPVLSSRRAAEKRARSSRTFTWMCLAGLVSLGANAAPTSTTQAIKLDQFGYAPGMKKVAVVANPKFGLNSRQPFSPGVGLNQYEVRRWSDNVVVFQGTLVQWKDPADPSKLVHQQSGDAGWHFDFSSLTTPGSYYIFDRQNNVGSDRFEIQTRVYDAVLRQAVRTVYYQRLNIPKVRPFAEAPWLDDRAAYQGNNQDRRAQRCVTVVISSWENGCTGAGAASERDLSGGWMDAGDTNKYTTFARNAVLQLLNAYRSNPKVFADNTGIPESGNGLPDVLDEVKFELDFIKRMQDATGTNGLFLKVGTDTYEGRSPISADTRPRYYLPECSSATLAGAAMFASGAATLKAISSQTAYAADLQARAERAFARANATTNGFSAFETACDNQSVKAGDADHDAQEQLASAVMAAIYLYEATGKAEYRTFVQSRMGSLDMLRPNPWGGTFWGPYSLPLQTALLRFTRMPNVPATVATTIFNSKAQQKEAASLLQANRQTDLYRSYMDDWMLHWGSNMVRAQVGLANLDFTTHGVDTANSAAYRSLAAQHLHWLHGANPLGLVMLSNMSRFGAERSVNELNHAWFADGSVWDSAAVPNQGPAPGYLTGGPNKSYSGCQTGNRPTECAPGISDQPLQKAYKDWNNQEQRSYEISEPAIYYQAAYVELLARLIEADNSPPTTPAGLAVSAVTSATAVLSWAPAADDVGVSSYVVLNADTGNPWAAGVGGTRLVLTGLNCGRSYRVAVRAEDAAGNRSAQSAVLTFATPSCVATQQNIFSDALAAGWSDWSWGGARFFDHWSPGVVGTRAIRMEYQAYGGLSLRHSTGFTLGNTGSLRFWAYSPVATTLQVQLQATDDSPAFSTTNVSLAAAQWKQISVTIPAAGASVRVKRVSLQSLRASASVVLIDELQLAGVTGP